MDTLHDVFIKNAHGDTKIRLTCKCFPKNVTDSRTLKNRKGGIIEAKKA